MSATTFPTTYSFDVFGSAFQAGSALKNETSFSYDGLTQNLSREQKEHLQLTLASLASPDIHIVEIAAALQGFDPNSYLFDNVDYPYYALLGVEENKVSKEDFCMLMYYWALRKKLNPSEIQSIPIFSGAHPTRKARELLDPTFLFHPKPSLEKDKEGKESCYELLDAAQKDAFYEKLSLLSPMQRQFFLIPDVPVYDSDGDRITSVTDRLQTEVGFNVFGRVRVNGTEMRIIPSPGMMQTYLDVKHGPCAAKIDPCFEASSNEAIESKISEGKRDLATPFPLYPLPHSADSFYAEDIDFVLHDFYHAEMFSLIPLKDRTKFMQFLVLLKEHSKTFPHHLEYCQYLHEAIIDMEFGSYREHRVRKQVKKGNPHIFWNCLWKAALKSSSLYCNKNSTLDAEEWNLLMKERYADLMESNLFDAIFLKLILYHPHYEKHTFLNIKELFQMKEPKPFIEIARQVLSNYLMKKSSRSLEKVRETSPNVLLRTAASQILEIRKKWIEE